MSKSIFFRFSRRAFWLCVILSVFSNGSPAAQSARTRGAFRKNARLLYLPLDERFATRDWFLALAKITDFTIATPEKRLLSDKKRQPEMRALLGWTQKAARTSEAAVISADMLLYGGLIASRTSRDSLAEIRARLEVLENIRRRNPRLPVYVSTTVMRMPSYSSAEEEPDYYAQYGRQIFLFSEASHRYEVTGEAKDKQAADEYAKQIPPPILEDYLTRRTRNFNVNKALIELVKTGVINRLAITLDDNAEYGLFKKEAAALARLAAGAGDRITIYPGADEAQLPLLARFALREREPKVFVAYRYAESKRLIPAFEGQPLETSVNQQIAAAGGVVTNDQTAADCVLYVNNFREKQMFPPKTEDALSADAEPLDGWLERAGIRSIAGKVLILADNNYYNGADKELIAGLFASRLAPQRLAYAGWNTSGNTLGSAIAMGFLRLAITENNRSRREYEKLLWIRLIEDWAYMTEGRELIRADLKKRNLANFDQNPALEKEYAQQMTTLFNARALRVNRFLKTNFTAEKVFFPWHRSFEIGFQARGEEQRARKE